MAAPRTTRRRFLTSTLAASVGTFAVGRARSAWSWDANEKLGVALVGVGGRGRWFVGSIPNCGERVVAMCDVNEQRAAESFARLPDVPKFRDFRKMLDAKGSEIDAVVVATPDNTHAVASMAAMKAGKHVYCEKPLTHSVFESRALATAAGRLGIATSMGNQGTASEGYRRALEIVQTGLLGDVREVHAWKDGGGSGDRPLPKGSMPVPKHLAWDLWLGPAAERTYHSQWMRWHSWRDFGTSALGNWGCHVMNLPFRALRLDALWPSSKSLEETASPPPSPRVRIEAECSAIHTATFPRWAIIRWSFPKRDALPPATVTWYAGLGRRPEERAHVEKLMGRPLDFGDHGERKWHDHAGCLLVGSKGSMHLNGHNTTFTLLPKERFAKVDPPERFVLRSPGHEREWLRACRGERPAMAEFAFAGPLSEFVLLGHVATRFARGLEFDPRTMKIVGDAEADGALRRAYRQGWTLE